jgi:glycosyltransferase involved in cell wall biosynthesis
VTISVVIPAYNGGAALRECLASLAAHRHQFTEWIVVNDASTDDSIQFAEEFGARVIQAPVRKGPANARNLGALAATGDILLFLDADVRIHDDTIPRILQRFQDDADLTALFGSYDTDPAPLGLVSEYRNLLHSFVHHTGKSNASTFWSGCGAIRRELFLANGGFDVTFLVVEDIELGMRLVRQQLRVVLDPSIQVQHLKRWTLPTMINTDIHSRGIPWAKLILSSGRMPNDLNLSWSNRLSVALALLLTLSTGLFAAGFVLGTSAQLMWPGLLALLMMFAAIAAINMPFYRFLADRRSFKFASASMVLHLLYLFCCATAMTIAVGSYCGSLAMGKADREPVVSAIPPGE